ncbi:MAG: hypothetical protein EOP06_24035, partial [Proteobacteria bacterium]
MAKKLLVLLMMTWRLLTFTLSTLSVPLLGYCQSLAQPALTSRIPLEHWLVQGASTMALPKVSEKGHSVSSPTPEMHSSVLPARKAAPKQGLAPDALFYRRSGGGDSGGGGTGVMVRGRLRLKDFIECPLITITSTSAGWKGIPLSPRIMRLDSTSINTSLKNYAKVSDPLFASIISAAAALPEWYAVRSELGLDKDSDSKLAVFKSALGIILNANLLEKLDAMDQLGLAFHESLRMVSLGFGIDLGDREIEDLTCKAFSGQPIETAKYPTISSYMKRLDVQGSAEFRAENWVRWRLTFETIAHVNGRLLPSGSGTGLFYEREKSKFAMLELAAPGLAPRNLEEAFFTWAAREAPTECSSQAYCNYMEAWPSLPYQPQTSETRLHRWALNATNARYVAWTEQDTGVY